RGVAGSGCRIRRFHLALGSRRLRAVRRGGGRGGLHQLGGGGAAGLEDQLERDRGGRHRVGGRAQRRHPLRRDRRQGDHLGGERERQAEEARLDRRRGGGGGAGGERQDPVRRHHAGRAGLEDRGGRQAGQAGRAQGRRDRVVAGDGEERLA